MHAVDGAEEKEDLEKEGDGEEGEEEEEEGEGEEEEAAGASNDGEEGAVADGAEKAEGSGADGEGEGGSDGKAALDIEEGGGQAADPAEGSGGDGAAAIGEGDAAGTPPPVDLEAGLITDVVVSGDAPDADAATADNEEGKDGGSGSGGGGGPVDALAGLGIVFKKSGADEDEEEGGLSYMQQLKAKQKAEEVCPSPTTRPHSRSTYPARPSSLFGAALSLVHLRYIDPLLLLLPTFLQEAAKERAAELKRLREALVSEWLSWKCNTCGTDNRLPRHPKVRRTLYILSGPCTGPRPGPAPRPSRALT